MLKSQIQNLNKKQNLKIITYNIHKGKSFLLRKSVLKEINEYTEEEKVKFEKYLEGQIAKIDLPNKDEAFLRERMLTMYANPVRNYLLSKD